MTTLSFDPEHTLAGALYGLSPREIIALGIRLCDAVEQSVGADGCHGAVWPGNLTVADDQLAIGPKCSVGIAEMSPDALEYIAPEQFWGGEQSPASDVYSIGLLLYTALNDGVMPFFEAGAVQTSENRAAALRARMKGKALPYPMRAGRALGDVVCKALSFRAEERYATPGILKAALCSLPEGAELPAAAPVIPMNSEELKNAHSYKVDKDFESAEPEKPRRAKKQPKLAGAVDENMDAGDFRKPQQKGRWILPVVLLIVIIVAVILLLRGCRDADDEPFSIDPEVPMETVNPIHAPVPTASILPVEPETPEETEAPVETDAPEETAAEPTYEIYLADVTWEEARALCDQKGGHLATVRNEEQYNEIIRLAEENGASFVWLGAYRADNAQWYYVTGDTLSYTVWDKNEPSALDSDGTREDYLLLWYRKNQGYWSYNDMRNDPVSVAARTYSGKLAYVCEYDK